MGKKKPGLTVGLRKVGRSRSCSSRPCARANELPRDDDVSSVEDVHAELQVVSVVQRWDSAMPSNDGSRRRLSDGGGESVDGGVVLCRAGYPHECARELSVDVLGVVDDEGELRHGFDGDGLLQRCYTKMGIGQMRRSARKNGETERERER
ncbi:hypothetical protein QYE76_052223 [Lolium multiflorum]|uniref:Uncharacterized protein n=1 Tax=Lolium multiflorum TaxID=4521 RepID=A0AAD8SUM2_LOLMU|nr:hypothetical protein QYE76_052223 [Lolium multiflorum]